MTRRPQTKPRKSPGEKRAPVRAIRPPEGGLAQAMDDANQFRPPQVPGDATLLVAWTRVPGDNEQRTEHWQKAAQWKDALKSDFQACLDLQGHPGLYQTPAVHVEIHAARPGDDNNSLSRAKHAIDLLQILKLRRDGVRAQGLLSLIEDDKVLNPGNRTITERGVPSRDSGQLDRYNRPIKVAPYRVMIWVWDAQAC